MLTHRPMPILLILIATLFASANLNAQEDDELPPLYRAVPHDAIVYAQADLKTGWKPMLDLRRWAEDGAIGLNFFDIAQMLNDIDVVISSDELAAFYDGANTMAFSLIDVGMAGNDASVKWTFSIDHQNPETVIRVLEQTATAKIWTFQEEETTPESTIYRWQFPKKWLEQLFPSRRGWGWWGINAEKPLSDPIYLGIWNNRYLVMGASKGDVADAIEQYEFNDDLDLYDISIASRKAFQRALEESGDADMMVYWNIASSVTKASRLAERAAGGSGRRDPMESIAWAEVKQFRYLLMYGDYLPEVGEVNLQFTLEYWRAPEWVAIVPDKGMAPPLQSFCPPRPSFFMGFDLQDTSAMYERLRTFALKTAEANGSGKTQEELEAEFEEVLGFLPQDFLTLSSGQIAFFRTPPYQGEGEGEERPGDGLAMIFSVVDEAEARSFIRRELLSQRSPTARRYFYHTAERVFEDFELPDGAGMRRVGLTTYNSGDHTSFAHCLIDSHLIFGNRDTVVAAIQAHLSGENITQSEGFQAIQEKLPVESVAAFFVDFDWVGKYAEQVVPEGFQIWGERARGDEVMVEEKVVEGQEKGEESATNPSGSADRKLMVNLLQSHVRDLYIGGALVRSDDRLLVKFAVLNLPTAEQVSQIVVSVTKYRNRQVSYRYLAEVLHPELMREYLFEHGDLPATIDEYVANGGDLGVFRDPVLAGPGDPNLTLDQCFVWVGNHPGQDLTKALPIAHSRETGMGDHFFMLMTDGSVHEVDRETLDEVLAAAQAPESKPRFSRNNPSTLEDVRGRLRNQIKRARNGERLFQSGNNTDSGELESSDDW